jgi:uncharacterized protein YndB with AHSA1/START domain
MGIAALILVVLVLVVAGVLVAAAAKPDSFRVERSTSINAPPERVYPLIADFHRWTAWSPWEKIDPALRRTYSGAASGPGAVYEWEGNNKVGKGRMEILQARPPSDLRIKLDFLKPFEAHNTAEFTLKASPAGTNVTWAMYGPNTFMAKIMQVVVSMDKLIGKDFEAGLANLKAAAES